MLNLRFLHWASRGLRVDMSLVIELEDCTELDTNRLLERKNAQNVNAE